MIQPPPLIPNGWQYDSVIAALVEDNSRGGRLLELRSLLLVPLNVCTHCVKWDIITLASNDTPLSKGLTRISCQPGLHFPSKDLVQKFVYFGFKVFPPQKRAFASGIQEDPLLIPPHQHFLKILQ